MIRPILLSAAFVFCTPFAAFAQNLAFDSLTDEQAKSIIDEFSGNFTFTSVSGASPLGSVFGLEIALVAGITKTDEIASLAGQTDPNAEAEKIPHGGIVAMISVPFGITAEASFIPEVGSDEFKFKNMGAAVKWSLTSGLIELPFSLAVKAHMMKTDMTFIQTVGGQSSTAAFSNDTMGAMVLLSKSLAVIEPYIGVGMVKGDGEFAVSGAGAASVFADGSLSKTSDGTGAQLLAGIEANLLVLKAGAEVSNQFGITRFTAKVGVSF